MSKVFNKNLNKYFDEKEDTSKYNDEYSISNDYDILESLKIYNLEITNKKPKFKIGDKVRISLLKNTFEKGYTSNWCEQIYVIDDIKTSNVHYYYLKDLNGEKLDGTFYQEELLKTNMKEDGLYIIEKIIKKVGDKCLIKWKEYDDSFNSYVNKNDIVKYV